MSVCIIMYSNSLSVHDIYRQQCSMHSTLDSAAQRTEIQWYTAASPCAVPALSTNKWSRLGKQPLALELEPVVIYSDITLVRWTSRGRRRGRSTIGECIGTGVQCRRGLV